MDNSRWGINPTRWAALEREWEAYRLIHIADQYWEYETYPRLRLPSEMPEWLASTFRGLESEVCALHGPRQFASPEAHRGARRMLAALRKRKGAQGLSHFELAPGAEVTLSETLQPCGCLLVRRVRSSYTGQGHGSAAMRELCRLADHYGVVLHLDVERDPIGPLDFAMLDAWYRRLGFEGERYSILERWPESMRAPLHFELHTELRNAHGVPCDG